MKASWCLLGASWGPLGPLGDLLVPLGRLLGPSWGLLGRSSNLSPNLVRFWLPKGCQKGAKMAPKWDPKRTKIEDKIEHQKNTSLRPSWGRLVAILGRSWPHLGVNFGHFSLENVMFRENLGFRENVVSRPVLGRSWPDLGAQKSQNGPHMGPQKGPKTSPKPC